MMQDSARADLTYIRPHVKTASSKHMPEGRVTTMSRITVAQEGCPDLPLVPAESYSTQAGRASKQARSVRARDRPRARGLVMYAWVYEVLEKGGLAVFSAVLSDGVATTMSCSAR